MNKVDVFFNESPWTWKELFQLLFIVLVLVPFFVEYHLKNYMTILFKNELYSGTLTGFIMSIIFMISLYLVALKPKGLRWNEVGIRRFPVRYYGPIAGWTIVVIVVSIGLFVLLDLLVGIGTENAKTESLKNQLTTLNFTIGFISAALISPIYEEIFYRGFLYRFLRGKYGVTVSIFISSFIFMVVHIPTYNTLPVNFVTGVVFAWTYERSGSVIPGIIIHGIFNGIAIILTALG
ncbi:CPBP family intramembrane glutamic endopeptidase [Bacillus salitolerans]|uniref:CPBP family intramembrane glutamic endopeptidase n=1 Tax=Bacillus salitolerans TaxID=1437434 RepID=A0ABW4LUU1_9BACI